MSDRLIQGDGKYFLSSGFFTQKLCKASIVWYADDGSSVFADVFLTQWICRGVYETISIRSIQQPLDIIACSAYHIADIFHRIYEKDKAQRDPKHGLPRTSRQEDVKFVLQTQSDQITNIPFII